VPAVTAASAKTIAAAALIGAAASIPASKFKGITERRLQRTAEALAPHGAAEAARGDRSRRHPENMPSAVLADRVASFGIWLWNWDVGALREFSPCEIDGRVAAVELQRGAGRALMTAGAASSG